MMQDKCTFLPLVVPINALEAQVEKTKRLFVTMRLHCTLTAHNSFKIDLIGRDTVGPGKVELNGSKKPLGIVQNLEGDLDRAASSIVACCHLPTNFLHFDTYIFFNRSLNKDHSVCMNKALYCSQIQEKNGPGSGLRIQTPLS